MKDVILVCDCPDMPSFAKNAFEILFPNRPVPVIRKVLGKGVGQFYEIASALTKTTKKYAYYIKEEHQNVMVWDLVKGVQVL